jgi:hypothetical protein
MKKGKKILLITSISIIALVGAVILFASPLTKYLIEKYDEKYTGREIKMDWAYVNLFTGQIYFSNFKIYELKSDSVFFSAHGIGINVSMNKLFSKTYEISDLTIDRPKAMIMQTGTKRDFNFNDLIEKFKAKKDTIQDTLKQPIHFNLLNIKIKDGEFHYHEGQIPINYFVKKVNFESTGLHWDVDTVLIKYSFLPGTGTGEAKGDFTLNIKNLDYRLAAVVKKYDLGIIEQYLKDMSNYGHLRANFDADIKAKGNLKRARAVEAKGKMAINDFHFGKNPKEDFAAFERFEMEMLDLAPEDHKYRFDTISVQHPYFKYERYDHLDNIQTMFGKKGSNVKAVNASKEDHFNLIIEIADYVKKLAKNFLRSYFQVNRVQVDKADLRFTDYALTEEFAIAADPFSFGGDSIDKNKKRVVFNMKSGLKPYGHTALTLNINPKDSSDFDLSYHLEKIPLTIFNPYLIKYTSYPLDRGTMEFKGQWHVMNGKINSQNHLILIDPRIGEHTKNKGTNWVPVPLVMALVRERGNVIDYEIPITGDLNNPKFHLWDVITDLLKNIIVKPPTTGQGLTVRKTENEIEKSITVKWEMDEAALHEDQKKFLKKIAEFLKKDPKALISLFPVQYAAKEKEHILLFEAKKKYFLSETKKKASELSQDDSLQILNMSVKDSGFVKHLNNLVKGSLLFTVQDKSAHYVGNEIVNKKYNALVKERERLVKELFAENGTEKQVTFHDNKSGVPFDGYSYFKIDYKDGLPQELMEAYHKMNQLNSEPPRNKFLREHFAHTTNK